MSLRDLKGEVLSKLTQLQHHLQVPTKRKERKIGKHRVTPFTKDINNINIRTEMMVSDNT